MKLNTALAEAALAPKAKEQVLKFREGLPADMDESWAAYAAKLNLSAPAIKAALYLNLEEPARTGVKIGSQTKRRIDAVAQVRAWVDMAKFDSSYTKTTKNLAELLINQSKANEGLMLQLVWIWLGLRKGGAQDMLQELASQSLQVYSLVADRLSLGQIKTELENLSFKIINPEQYNFVLGLLEKSGASQAGHLKNLKQTLSRQLKAEGIKIDQLQGRQKHPYSIWQKLQKKSQFEQILDILAVRLVVPTTGSCYRALGVIHDLFEPVEGRLKDYIAKPKSNGYQSLHTVVKDASGQPVEIQIRTPLMHEVAEHGQAAHWHYHQAKGTRQYKHSQDISGRKTTASRRIYVFTPQGDLLSLPAQATALDFGFYVHTAVGLRAVGAKINGKMAKLDSPLKNGDTVEVMTQKAANPKEAWLRIVKSKLAKNRIRTWLKTTNKKIYEQLGEQLLKEEAIHHKIHPSKQDLHSYISSSKYADKEDLYVAIGSGILPAQQVIATFKAALRPKKTANKPVINSGKVKVGGMEGVSYRLAACCQPNPSKPVAGYLSKNLEVAVHVQGCPHLPTDQTRWIECEWA